MPSSLDALLVRHGRRDLLGSAGTFKSATALLRQLPFIRICDFASRLSAILHNESNSSAAVQVQLLNPLLGTKANSALARLRRYDQRDAARGRRVRRVVFDEQVALVAIRAAVLTNCSNEVEGASDAFDFGEAVVHLSDIVERQVPCRAAPSVGGDGQPWTWAYYLFVNALARYDEWEIHSISRAFEVVFRRSASLTSSPYYVDVDRLLRDGLGIGRAELTTIIFALQSHYRTLNASTVAHTSAAIDVEQLLERGPVRFAHAEYDAVLGRLSIDAAAFRNEVMSSYTAQSLGYLDVGRFYGTPFIRFGNTLVAPSVRLLLAKLSYGLHHTILFAIPSRHRKKYLQLIGESFESYIGETMRRIATTQGSGCLLEAELSDAARQPRGRTTSVADGLIFDETTILVWDAKSRTGAAPIYAGTALAAFREWYTELIEEVAAQCASTIKLQRAGAFESLGLDRRPRRVVAAIIPYLPIVPHQWLGRITHDLGATEAAKLSIDFDRFVIINPGEVEALEALVTRTFTLQGLVADWSARPEFNTGSFHNYCLSRRITGYGVRHSPFLDECFREMNSQMDAVIAERRAPSDGSDAHQDSPAGDEAP